MFVKNYQCHKNPQGFETGYKGVDMKITNNVIKTHRDLKRELQIKKAKPKEMS